MLNLINGILNSWSRNILFRKKVGFPVPLNNWFGGNFAKEFLEIISSNTHKFEKFICIQNIVDIVNKGNLEHDHSLSMKMWMVLNLCLFCQEQT